MNKQLSQLLYLGAGSLAVFGAVAQFLEHFYAPYVFSAGATLFIIIQAIRVFELSDASMREMRLARIGLFSSLLLALSAYFMFTNSNLWVVADTKLKNSRNSSKVTSSLNSPNINRGIILATSNSC